MLSGSLGLVESNKANLPPKTQGGEGLAGFCQAHGCGPGNRRFASFCPQPPAARAARRAPSTPETSLKIDCRQGCGARCQLVRWRSATRLKNSGENQSGG